MYTYTDKGYQFDAQFDKELTTGSADHFIIYGVSFSDKDIENINNEFNSASADKVIFYIPSASESVQSVFLQDEISVGNFILTPGLRFDKFKTKPGDASQNTSLIPQEDFKTFSDSALTGRLGTIFKINESHRLFAQFSQGFRAPDFKELYYSFGNPTRGYLFMPNANLKAEKSTSYEIGWRHNTEQSSSEIALFQSDYKNFIERKVVSGSGVPVRDPTIYQSVNIGKAKIKGVELSSQFSWDDVLPVEGVSTRVAAAYAKGKDGNDDPLNSVNPLNLVAGVNYDSVDNWGSSLKLKYTAKKKKKHINGDNIRPISSSTVLDLTAYYRPIDNLTLRAGVFNLTDEEYYNWDNVRGQTSEDQDLTEAKRNWSVTVKYDF